MSEPYTTGTRQGGILHTIPCERPDCVALRAQLTAKEKLLYEVDYSYRDTLEERNALEEQLAAADKEWHPMDEEKMALRAELAAIKKAFEPVCFWYNCDGEQEDVAAMITLAVADLADDRETALRLSREKVEWLEEQHRLKKRCHSLQDEVENLGQNLLRTVAERDQCHKDVLEYAKQVAEARRTVEIVDTALAAVRQEVLQLAALWGC